MPAVDSVQDNVPLNRMPPFNLFGLEEQDYSKAKVAVLPVPYDSTLTYKTGAREGPNAIIDASRNIELYSHELGRDISELGIYTLRAMAPDLSSPENMIAGIKREVGLLLDDGKLPLLLGGEHTITLGALQAFKEKGVELSILDFDAHTDSRQEIFGSRYTHATVMARSTELYPNIFQVGIRSMDATSSASLDRGKTITRDDVREKGTDAIVSQIVEGTGDALYLTFDMDALDPAEMPSVGTPEPDGLRFAEAMDIIKGVGRKKKLLGADFVELSPIPHMHAPDFLAAKLIYLTLGYSMFGGK